MEKKVKENNLEFEKKIGKQVLQEIDNEIKAEIKRISKAATQGAWIDHYLLIDFGFSDNVFYPNSIQFYSSTGFLCSKRIDNTSLTSLIPILNCDKVRVTWDTVTKKAVHIYGYESK